MIDICRYFEEVTGFNICLGLLTRLQVVETSVHAWLGIIISTHLLFIRSFATAEGRYQTQIGIPALIMNRNESSDAYCHAKDERACLSSFPTDASHYCTRVWPVNSCEASHWLPDNQ